MPQASDELRKIVAWIIQPKLEQAVPADGLVVQYLKDRGYELRDNWTWKIPNENYFVNEMDEMCLRYLVDEWDYGWIEK